ncbi:MAG: hypothetical protein KBT27_02095 [Prevotellaceae bacterium]|nr:hypothetical protein [Candidatus Faecinaster equi]
MKYQNEQRNTGIQNVEDWHRGVVWEAERLEDILLYQHKYQGLTQQKVEEQIMRVLEAIKNETQAIADAKEDYKNGSLN